MISRVFDSRLGESVVALIVSLLFFGGGSGLYAIVFKNESFLEGAIGGLLAVGECLLIVLAVGGIGYLAGWFIEGKREAEKWAMRSVVAFFILFGLIYSVPY